MNRHVQTRPHSALRPFGHSAILLFLSLVGAAPAAAQYATFGQNKVQYRRFDWQVAHGAHVDLYYYPAEAQLVPATLAAAEENYQALTLKFGHTVSARIPIIIYASHTDFEQTNILPFQPPEGLLGVTDYLKRRVALPFRGNFAEFRHTLRHEMVHAFQLSLSTDLYVRSPRAAHIPLPLWWTEGLAEYWSAGEDARDEMVLRDLVFTGRLPPLQQLTYVEGGIVYPLGGRIHRWLGETYGDWRVAQLYHELWRYESFEAAIEGVYGKKLEQLNEEFQLAMRRAYYPVANGREPLTVRGRLVASLAIKPAYVPGDSGGQVLYLTGANGWLEVARKPLDGGRARTLVTAGRSAALESFHPFESRFDATRAGYLLLSSKSADRDVLLIWDLTRRKVVGRYQYPELTSILDPAWGPDGKSVIFSGLTESGVSDLFRITLPSGTLERLTDDVYQDLDPSLSPDGRRIVFTSDRTQDGDGGAVNLFIKDLASGELRQLTSGRWVDETPRWTSEDRIYFTSDRDGVLNIFSTDTLGNGRRETSSWTGAFDPEVVPDRDALLVSGYNDLRLGVYYLAADSAARTESFTLGEAPAPSAWQWPTAEPVAGAKSPSEPYRRHYALDFAAGEAVFIPRYGGAQAVTFYVSDLLSDNVAVFSLATYQGRRIGSLLENLNATALYLNQTRRLNWGIGAFRSKGNNFEGDLTVSYEENAVGAFGLLRYPLSRFTRIEGQFVVEHSDRFDFALPVADPRRVGWIASHYLSYVHDNALWLSSGPIDGGRFAVTAGISNDFSNARFDSFLLSADWRQYLRIAKRTAFAVRAFGFYSGGDRPQRVNIGGTLALRGYPLYGYIVGSKAFMFNQELRFPLLDYLSFGLPLGELRLPDIQGALFFDFGKAWYLKAADRALIGSAGISFRLPLAPFTTLRLDWGRRFSDNNYLGYGLSPGRTSPGFVQFFFGYNY